MTARAHKPAAMADPLEVFVARCEARATLVREGILELHEAIDGLQAAAMRYGLINQLGQDAVQAIMAKAFAILDEDVTGILEPDETARRRDVVAGAAASTVEALMFSLRERGVAALAERDCLRRLAELSTAQVYIVIQRLIAARARFPAIDDELLFKLGEQLA